MCRDCGSRDPGRRFAVDGTGALLCASCIGDLVAIAEAHELNRRLMGQLEDSVQRALAVDLDDSTRRARE